MSYIYDHGTGIESDPFQIWTAGDLNGARDYLSSYFVQKVDIDLSVYSSWEPIGSISNKFRGKYDGGNHAITGLTVNGSLNSNYHCGLFGYTDSSNYVNDTEICNLFIIDAYVWGMYNVGIVAGRGYYVNIHNCYVTGTVVAGDPEGGNIAVGGLVGELKGVVSNCYSSASVALTVGDEIGGLLGEVVNQGAGSIVSNCYSVGVISHPNDAIYIGGLIGHKSFNPTISSCYYDSQVSGRSDNDGRGTPKTTAEMKQQSTYSSWDFVNVWSIDDSYPYFKSEKQISSGDKMYPDKYPYTRPQMYPHTRPATHPHI